MLKLMSILDIVIAKPGPATILELQRLNKKVIFTAPIGYQEYGNVDYLLKNPNFRYVGKEYCKLKKVIEELLNSDTVPYDDNMKDASDIGKRLVDLVNLKK